MCKERPKLNPASVVEDTATPSPPQASFAVRLAGWVLLVLLATIAIWIVDRKADKDQPGLKHSQPVFTAHAGAVGNAAAPFAGPR